MLRDDTSPVKERIKSLAETSRSISFAACGNTRANMSRAEKKGNTAHLAGYGCVVWCGAGNRAAGTGLELRAPMTHV
jgi:hypothetical protein